MTMLFPSWSSLFDDFERYKKSFEKIRNEEKGEQHSHRFDSKYIWEDGDIVYSSEKEWDGDKLIKNEVVDKRAIASENKNTKEITFKDCEKKYDNKPEEPAKSECCLKKSCRCKPNEDENSVRIDIERYEELVEKAAESEEWKEQCKRTLKEYGALQRKHVEVVEELEQIKNKLKELLN